MSEPPFIGYVGEADFHDGSILTLSCFEHEVIVRLRGASGRVYVIDFTGVQAVRLCDPEGMMVYSLSEMRNDPPLRRFVFTNWDDESKEFLEIDAYGFAVRNE
jgi:hypothetical protein